MMAYRETSHRLRVVRCCPASVDLDVAAPRPPKLLQCFPGRRVPGACVCVALGIAHQHADAPHTLSLLRAHCYGPRRRCAAENRDELAASHSITSSARARNGSGMVNPIARAVLILRTNSNFVACSTCKSAGCVPVKILSTQYEPREYI